MAKLSKKILGTADLHLDAENPRLPEHLLHGDEAEILAYLFENDVLDELAESFLDNGYFEFEPLIVKKAPGAGWIVLEGNRRLAALQILLGINAAQDADLEFSLETEPSVEQLQRLRRVPCYVVADTEEVRHFLGFRHIGGLKMWSPEAKARYVSREVKRMLPVAQEKGANVFTLIGREVGSNAQGVRNPYIAIRILQYASDEFGIDVVYIQRRRFGVWVRCMNSTELRQYIGFNGARTYEEIEDGLKSLREKRLSEVVADLTPAPGERKAVLADSRDVTDYARVLVHKEAHRALRKFRDLVVARQIVDRTELPARLNRLADSLSVLLSEIEGGGAAEELLPPAERVFSHARSLRALVKGLVEEE
jgi:hypothetical protein